MSETTPLNEWPLDELRKLFNAAIYFNIVTGEYDHIINALKSAIKDAEEKLNELPFK